MTEPALVVPPNVAALAVQFARVQLDDAGLDVRVGTVSPPDPVLPFARVTQWGQRRAGLDGVAWVTVHELQVDAWAQDKVTAHETAATLWAAFVGRFRGLYEYGDATGVVTAVEAYGLRDLPDETFSPARPRWTFQLAVWAHPAQ